MILESGRILLRPFESGDLADLHAYASQPGVGEMAGWKHHEDLAESREMLDAFLAAPNTFALVSQADGRVIGHLAVHDDSEDGRADTKELGFVLSRDYQRLGIMTEAVRALLDQLRSMGIRHVYACCFQDNAPSKGLIEKCGFRFEQEGTYHSKSLDRTFASFEYVIDF